MVKNTPTLKLGIVAVSRNCFPEELSVNRRKALITAYQNKFGSGDIYECPVCIVESELHVKKALRDLEKAECNALCVFLGNFGPEIAESMLASEFDGPVMFCGAAEETQSDLKRGRGDAFCGMLNACYALNLRNTRVYLPAYPIGTADECADMLHEFMPIARTALALRSLKIISFGPRPANFLACNAPIKPLYDLGIEIEENSELDLLEAFNKHEGDARILGVVAEMEKELGSGNGLPDILPRLAQYELTLKDWIRTHKGNKKYVALTTRCWPAFQTQFGFVPCYVNSRFTAQGIPISCEADIYGALSEYIGICASQDIVTILDINNTVPMDMYKENIADKTFEGRNYKHTDTFMGFHCGNTSVSKLINCKMKNQFIMSQYLPDELTKGTVEGDIEPGKITLFRLQSTSEARLQAYVANGQILPVATKSYGSTAVFAVPEMGRFYRHVLLEKRFPHHGIVLFGYFGKTIYEVCKYLGLADRQIDFNHPRSLPYASENPFVALDNWY